MRKSETDWASVDSNPEPEQFISFLDQMNALAAVRRYKEKTFALLDLSPGKSLLDVGCGTGEDALALAKLSAPGKVVGLDISQRMIEEARKRNVSCLSNISYQVGDAHHLAFEDESFDRCRIDRVFQHIPQPALALKEVKRVLKAGGILVMSEPDWRTLMLGSCDSALTYKVVDTICGFIPNCRMGRSLPELLTVAGFNEINLLAETLIVRSFSLAEKVFGLLKACERLVKEGTISKSEGTAFLEDLESREKAGHFFAAITGFAAQARKH